STSMPDETLPMKYVKREPYCFFKVAKPSSLVSRAKTFAPFFKKTSACACPIPEAAPVMKTVFSLYSSNSIVLSSKIIIAFGDHIHLPQSHNYSTTFQSSAKISHTVGVNIV